MGDAFDKLIVFFVFFDINKCGSPQVAYSELGCP